MNFKRFSASTGLANKNIDKLFVINFIKHKIDKNFLSRKKTTKLNWPLSRFLGDIFSSPIYSADSEHS